MNILIIDNYDSFTYNLYQYVGEILTAKIGCAGFNITVKRNDEITLEEIKAEKYNRIIISPGPGTPLDRKYFGICADVICDIGPSTPILGVCLGMQGIAHCFGGEIARASVPMHGKTSIIKHDGQGVYRDLPQNLEIMRYHSLIVVPESLPDCLEITSVTTNLQTAQSMQQNDLNLPNIEIMGLRHKQFPIEGIQYHPESFATEGGKKLLENFLLHS